MPCLRVAVHVGVGEPGLEIVQIDVGEHPITGTPDQQGRHITEVGEPIGHGIEHRRRRMVGFERDVRNELTDGLSTIRRVVRRQIAATDLGGGPRVRQLEHAPQERRGLDRDLPQPQRPAGVSDQGRRRRLRRLVHRRVREYQTDDVEGVVLRVGVLQPTQGDRSAPVVSDHDHVAAELEHVGERHQIGDAIAQPT